MKPTKKITMFDFIWPQVQSHLESSKFHLHQSQNQQVKQYLTLGSKLASSVGQGHAIPHPHGPGQPLATMPIMRNGNMPSLSDGSNPTSPVTLLTMASHDSEVSQTELNCGWIYGTEIEKNSECDSWWLEKREIWNHKKIEPQTGLHVS